MTKIQQFGQRISDGAAFLISAFFSPYITAAVFIAFISYHFSQNLGEFLPWMLTFMFFAIIIPGFYVMWLLEKKQIRDFHIYHLNDRKIPFLITGVSAIVGTIVLYFLGAAKPVFVISVAYAANVMAIALLTQFWKVSIHTSLFSAVATIALILFGTSWWWLYLLLIPLAWSRIYRRRHTIWQAVGGAIVAFVLTTAVFWGFGYL